MLAVAVVGATGRMGRSLMECIEADEGSALSGALCSPSNPGLGRSVAECAPGLESQVILTADPLEALRGADVAIDFSLPQATRAVLEAACASGCPLVLCTTGLDAGIDDAVAEAAGQIPLLRAANTSLGVAVLARLAGEAARMLGESYDVEILDIHHRGKRDIPSGTALQLGRAAAAARGQDFAAARELRGETRDGPRRSGSIGFAALRGGDIPGEHTVLFAGDGEMVELTHKVRDRATFARGALAAARWLAGRSAGLYGMDDVLGLARVDTPSRS
jgi:4-hydroxy-tetrahydrodipicolinate reductase